MSIQEWVTRTARRRPMATAVVGEDTTFTYGELEAYSNRLARALRAQGCTPGDRVAVLMPKSARAVACYVGILKAGCIYVPLDPSDRRVRTAEILRRSEPRVLLAGGCDPGLLENFESRRALRKAVVGWLSLSEPPASARFTLDDVTGSSAESLPFEAHPDDVAYMLFTSGERDPLRGVPITHRNVRAFVEWAVDHFGMGSSDRVAGSASLTQALSSFDIHATFAAGAELHQIPASMASDPRRVVDFIEDRAVTVWLSAPSILRHATGGDVLAGRDLSSLRHVAWCGDSVPTPSLHYWRKHVPGAELTNLYGATEVTVASAYTVPSDFGRSETHVPIGTGCAGHELLILTDDFRRAAEGEVGDVYVRGPGLSPGYWQETEGTQWAFPTNPEVTDGSDRLFRTGDRGRVEADGRIRFLGRADVKLAVEGPGLEPDTLEYAILQLPDIEACVVVPVTVSTVGTELVGCAYVPRNGKTLRTQELRDQLADSVPWSMIPARWLILEELPVDRHGKVDRTLVRTLLRGWPADREVDRGQTDMRRVS